MSVKWTQPELGFQEPEPKDLPIEAIVQMIHLLEESGDDPQKLKIARQIYRRRTGENPPKRT